MELLIFGHAGAKVLMFPTRDGRFWEYEKLEVVARLADKVDAGHLQLYCIEGLARETFYDSYTAPPSLATPLRGVRARPRNAADGAPSFRRGGG
jgi:esterase/lipase superfamily enzyme